MEDTDKDLLGRIAEKKTEAFDMFYTRYRRSFHNWVYVHTANQDMTDDIMQNFWVDVWIRPFYFKPDETGCVKRFMLQNLSYRILDYLKSPANRLQGNGILLSEAENTIAYSHVLEELTGDEINSLIDRVMDELPQIARDIFVLRMRRQYSVGKTAATLNISEKTVRERYNWTLSILRNRLTELYPEGNTSYHLYLLLLLMLSE